MNIPAIPTDNLYKFCALFGTVIILFSLYIPYKYSSEVEKQISSVNLNVNTTVVQQKYLIQKIDRLKEILENSILKNKGLYEYSQDVVELNYSQEELKEILSESYELYRDTQISDAKNENLDNESDRLIKQLKAILEIRTISLGLGIILSIFGYVQWYFKIQRYQDQILKKSINN